jgi:hypothetical protein
MPNTAMYIQHGGWPSSSALRHHWASSSSLEGVASISFSSTSYSLSLISTTLKKSRAPPPDLDSVLRRFFSDPRLRARVCTFAVAESGNRMMGLYPNPEAVQRKLPMSPPIHLP